MNTSDVRKRLLIVDDDPDVRGMLQTAMRAYGYPVETAANGKEGVEKYLAGEFFAVIMDIIMPEMDGVEATEKIMAHDPKARIVIVTGEASATQTQRVMDAGIIGIVFKPLRIAELQEVIDEEVKKDALARSSHEERHYQNSSG